MRRPTKARIARLLEAARNGLLKAKSEDDDEPETIPGPFIRARCLKAFRRHEQRAAKGIEEEESDDAQAGAILDAERDHDIHRTAEMMEAFLKACREQ